jgi:hypothetical protein
MRLCTGDVIAVVTSRNTDENFIRLLVSAPAVFFPFLGVICPCPGVSAAPRRGLGNATTSQRTQLHAMITDTSSPLLQDDVWVV